MATFHRKGDLDFAKYVAFLIHQTVFLLGTPLKQASTIYPFPTGVLCSIILMFVALPDGAAVCQNVFFYDGLRS